MSKKKRFVILFVLGAALLVAAAVLIVVLLPREENSDENSIKVGWFRYEYYERAFKDDPPFDDEVFLGDVSTAEKAIAAAKKVFIEYYGAVPMVTDWKYDIKYDFKNKVWLVYTSYPEPYTFSGGYYAMIDRDTGKLISIWLSK